MNLVIDVQGRFSALDDGFVIEATLAKSSDVENVNILHITEDEVNSTRREGVGIYVSRLTVDSAPGDFHEAEIARILGKIYQPKRVYVGPKVEGGREFCDVLSIGKHEAICIQAKSTLRTEASLSETDDRRRNRMTKHFRKAARQVWGTERAFYGFRKQVTFRDAPIPIDPQETLLMHVIVVSEKHSGDLDAWSPTVHKLVERCVFVVVLDMAEFVNIANNCEGDRQKFCAALFTVDKSFKEVGRIGEYVVHASRLATY
jgi:hypothetical protein